MYKLEGLSTEIELKLQNGLYLFENKSSTGKTRLCKVIREYQMHGEPVASYSYGDMLIGLDINRILVPNKYRVIMLDRYDMYKNECNSLIKECANSSIVMIDCKQSFTVSNNYRLCYINMSPYKIEVET